MLSSPTPLCKFCLVPIIKTRTKKDTLLTKEIFFLMWFFSCATRTGNVCSVLIFVFISSYKMISTVQYIICGISCICGVFCKGIEIGY